MMWPTRGPIESASHIGILIEFQAFYMPGPRAIDLGSGMHGVRAEEATAHGHTPKCQPPRGVPAVD